MMDRVVCSLVSTTTSPTQASIGRMSCPYPVLCAVLWDGLPVLRGGGVWLQGAVTCMYVVPCLRYVREGCYSCTRGCHRLERISCFSGDACTLRTKHGHTHTHDTAHVVMYYVVRPFGRPCTVIPQSSVLVDHTFFYIGGGGE